MGIPRGLLLSSDGPACGHIQWWYYRDLVPEQAWLELSILEHTKIIFALL